MRQQTLINLLSKVEITGETKENLVDAGSITLDNNIPREYRAAFLLKKLKNPYCFRVGDIGVKLEFSDGAPTLQETFDSFLIRKKSGL